MARKCGYCRLNGHWMPDCPTRAEHRRVVLTHTPLERKFLLAYMAKQGFGDGAVLRTGGYYMTEGTAILNGGDWINTLQYVGQTKVRYSKQVSINPNQSIDRVNDVALDNQFGHISANAFVSTPKESRERNLHMTLHDIAHPRMMDVNNDRGYSVALLEPSYKPYDVSPEHLASNVLIHKRLFIPGETTYDRWSDYTYIPGVIPT